MLKKMTLLTVLMLTGCASSMKSYQEQPTIPDIVCERPNRDHLTVCVASWIKIPKGDNKSLIIKLGEVVGDARDCAARHLNLVEYINGCQLLNNGDP